MPIPFPEFHPKVNEVSRSLYDSGHYTDALRKSSIKLEEVCKDILKEHIGDHEFSGQVLISKLINYRKEKQTDKSEIEKDPYLQFYNISSSDGKDKQQNTYKLFAGVFGIIRNDLAHSTRDLEDIVALYGLNIISYLFYKMDSVSNNSQTPIMKNKEKYHQKSVYDFEVQEDELVDIYIDSPNFQKEKASLMLATDKLSAKSIVERSVDNFIVDIIDEKIELYNLYTNNVHYKNMVISKIISINKKT